MNIRPLPDRVLATRPAEAAKSTAGSLAPDRAKELSLEAGLDAQRETDDHIVLGED